MLPFDQSSYNDYAGIRGSLLSSYAQQPGGSTRTRETLLALEPMTLRFGSRQFALPPQMGGMHQLFQQGKAAIVGNVGPLIEPTHRTSFVGRKAALPARLFSHNDQQSTWMSFAPEGSPLGWGGRFGDAAAQVSANSDNNFSQISVAGNSVFLTGVSVSPYEVGTDGVPVIGLIAATESQFGSIMRDHFTAAGSDRSNLFERDLINISRISLDANEALDHALQDGSSLSTAFPASELGAQLEAVARIIAVRATLGASRQVFFVGIGGFDTHSGQAINLPVLQQEIGDSIAAFYAATEELGIANEVTTFTAADFGRSLKVNGDGSDHGWGSHHFIVGGAVKGGDIYGDIPVSQLGHEQDAGNGRLIPTVSVEQFAAPLGRWFGLDDTQLATALPGLSRFPATPLAFI